MNKIQDTIDSIYNMNLEELSDLQIQEMMRSLNALDITVKQRIQILELEDKNKRLTLTDEQYKTWLETDIFYINTEQFEILYGINKRKQAELRSYRKDFLPSFQIDGKGKHYYNKKEVENWLSNHKRLNLFN